jgi:hypothetical protein
VPAAADPDRFWEAAKAILRAFVFPDAGWTVAPEVLTAVLVVGLFLLVTGALAAAYGGNAIRIGLASAAAAGIAAWAFAGGRREVLGFFTVITLVLGFLGGMTFVLGFVRTPWVALGLALCILLAGLGVVEARLLGTLLAFASSLLGAWSLYKRFETYSPGRRGSRWNRASAAGWTLCLLAATALDAPGLGLHRSDFKGAGMVVGAALLLLFPRARQPVKAA